MLFEEKKITLKDGRIAVLRSPGKEDAEGLLKYLKSVCGETEFLGRYPEELNVTVEQEEKWAEGIRSSKNTLGITCFVGGEIAGNCEIRFMGGMKISHRACVSIAICKEYWNLGIGTAMFSSLVDAAKERKIEILELEFIEGNERARHLYEKFGFQTVCVRPKAFKLKDGTYRDEIFMQKYL